MTCDVSPVAMFNILLARGIYNLFHHNIKELNDSKSLNNIVGWKYNLKGALWQTCLDQRSTKVTSWQTGIFPNKQGFLIFICKRVQLKYFKHRFIQLNLILYPVSPSRKWTDAQLSGSGSRAMMNRRRRRRRGRRTMSSLFTTLEPENVFNIISALW